MLFGSVRGEFAPGAIAASRGTKCTLKFIPFFSPECGRAQEGKLCAAQPPSGDVDGLDSGRAGQVLLVPTFQQILPSAACAEPDFVWKSFCKKIPGQCQFKAGSALWVCLTLLAWGLCATGPREGFGEKRGKFPFCRNKLQYLQRIGSTGNAFVPKSQERFGQ